MAIVEVRPIKKEKWHGKEGKDSFTAPKTVEALVSLRTRRYSTGLSTEDRERLEKITGYDLSDIYIQEKAHPFWSSTGVVKLEDKTNVFDTSIPINEIKVKLLKASDLVANSMKEYEEGKYPDAIFVIFDEQEENEIKATRASIKRKVIIESAKLPIDKKIEIIQILLGISTKGQSNDYIELKFDECIDKFGADKLLTIMQRDKSRNTTHSLVLEAIQKNVLRKEGSSIYYMDDQLGFDLEATMDYLEDKKNQLLRAAIIEKIN
jgi:hypothetical protein